MIFSRWIFMYMTDDGAYQLPPIKNIICFTAWGIISFGTFFSFSNDILLSARNAFLTVDVLWGIYLLLTSYHYKVFSFMGYYRSLNEKILYGIYCALLFVGTMLLLLKK